jgi:hypothetical protein
MASGPGVDPLLGPPSAPGWEVDAAAERYHDPNRRRTRLTVAAIAMCVVGAVVGAFVARGQLPASTDLRPAFASNGINLDDVVVGAWRRLQAEPLTAEQRHRGFNECYLPDPMGLGPYAPYYRPRSVIPLRIAIPQEGGYTDDLGYDVVVHFHGGEAVRKNLVQVSRGSVFVAVDLGLFSGPYMRAFMVKRRWQQVKDHITDALREHAGDDRAHIRHLALTGWSAGYGAVNEILRRNGDEGIDAVVLLDGMHAGQNLRRPTHDGSIESLSSATLRATFDFAGRAVRGEKIFVLTHSNIVPPDYASVKQSADLLLHELGVERKTRERQDGLAQQLTTADAGNFHVWGYAGTREKAHCVHTAMLGPIVRDVLEPAWGTPAMNRDVPMTPTPKLGTGTPQTGNAATDPVTSGPIQPEAIRLEETSE